MKPLIFALFVLGCCAPLVGVAQSGETPARKVDAKEYSRGEADARRDLNQGKIIYEIFGQPSLFDRELQRIASEDYGITVKFSGCMPGPRVDHDRGYLDTVIAHLKAKDSDDPVLNIEQEIRTKSGGVVAAGQPAAVAQNDFTLECVLRGDVMECSLRNISGKTLRYSNYTIGYHQAVIVERFDAASGTWLGVPRRQNFLLVYKGAGASTGNIREVAAGAVVPPERSDDKSPSMSFGVRLAYYSLPKNEVQQVRITQVMGTCLGSELPVWKGRVTSSPVKYAPARQPAESRLRPTGDASQQATGLEKSLSPEEVVEALVRAAHDNNMQGILNLADTAKIADQPRHGRSTEALVAFLKGIDPKKLTFQNQTVFSGIEAGLVTVRMIAPVSMDFELIRVKADKENPKDRYIVVAIHP